MKKEQSSIEWLIEQITYKNDLGGIFFSFREDFELSKYIDKFKELHKKEIIEAYIEGRSDHEAGYYNEKYSQ